MMNIIKKSLIWISLTVIASIIGYYVWKYIEVHNGLYNPLKQILNNTLILITTLPPLWATTAISALCGLFVYLKLKNILSPDTSISEKTFPSGSLIWKYTINKHKDIYLNPIPLCGTHVKLLISGRKGYYCPEVVKNNNCTVEYTDAEYVELYKTTKTIITEKHKN